MDNTSEKKLHRIFAIPIFMLFLFFVIAGMSIHPKNDPRFHGMWKLDIIEYYDSTSGTWNHYDTDQYHDGFILYDGKGHMSVHLTSKGYKDFDVSENVDSLDMEALKERLKFYQSNFVYVADYETKNNIINHHRLSATDPINWGTVLTRDFEFKNDTLILSARESIDANRLRLRWVKY